MTDLPDRELAVFSAARRLPAAERATYLDQACAGDATLRQHIEQLLQADGEAGAFLDNGPSAAQPPLVAASAEPRGQGGTVRISLPSLGKEPGGRRIPGPGHGLP